VVVPMVVPPSLTPPCLHISIAHIHDTAHVFMPVTPSLPFCHGILFM
jgi:hypothetical protein